MMGGLNLEIKILDFPIKYKIHKQILMYLP